MGRKNRQPTNKVPNKVRTATPITSGPRSVPAQPVSTPQAAIPIQPATRPARPPRAATPIPAGPRRFELRSAAAVAALLSGSAKRSKEPADLPNGPSDLIRPSTLLPPKPSPRLNNESPKGQDEVKDKQDLEREEPLYGDVMKDKKQNESGLFQLHKDLAIFHTDTVLTQITGRWFINRFAPIRPGLFEKDDDRNRFQSLANEIFKKFSCMYSICRTSLVSFFLENDFSEENLAKLQHILCKSAMVKGLIFQIVEARALLKFDKVSVPTLDSLYGGVKWKTAKTANPKIYSEQTKATIRLLLTSLKELSEVDNVALEFMTRKPTVSKSCGFEGLEPSAPKHEESEEIDGNESDLSNLSWSNREDPDAQLTNSDLDPESDFEITLPVNSKTVKIYKEIILNEETPTSKGQTSLTTDKSSAATINNEGAKANKRTKNN